MPIGTFGAFISLKDPLPDRKALFDVGASGPVVGFLVAIPILLIGLSLTNSMAQPVPDIGRPELAADLPYNVTAPGTGAANLDLAHLAPGPAVLTLHAPAPQAGYASWTYTLDATVHLANGTTQHQTVAVPLAAGDSTTRTLNLSADATAAQVAVTWDDGLVEFGDPLLVTLIEKAWPSPGQYLMHPTELAGWAGLLVTGLNLLPLGQLDGGHVARGVFGDNSRRVAQATLFGLVALSLVAFSWMFVAVFVLLTGVYHPPPLNDRSQLGRRRMALAGLVLVVFALTFVPVPIHF